MGVSLRRAVTAQEEEEDEEVLELLELQVTRLSTKVIDRLQLARVMFMRPPELLRPERERNSRLTGEWSVPLVRALE